MHRERTCLRYTFHLALEPTLKNIRRGWRRTARRTRDFDALLFSHYYLSTFGWIRVALAPGIGNERSIVLVEALSNSKSGGVRRGTQLESAKEMTGEEAESKRERGGVCMCLREKERGAA